MARKKQTLPDEIGFQALKLNQVAFLSGMSYQRAMRSKALFARIEIPMGKRTMIRYLDLKRTVALREGIKKYPIY